MKPEDTVKPAAADFDPDLSRENSHNVQAAKDRGWRFDPRRNAYVDGDGCLMADKFGQPF